MARESEGDLRILSFRIMYVRLDLFGSVFMVSLEGCLRPTFRDGKKSVADVRVESMFGCGTSSVARFFSASHTSGSRIILCECCTSQRMSSR